MGRLEGLQGIRFGVFFFGCFEVVYGRGFGFGCVSVGFWACSVVWGGGSVLL